MKNAKKLLLTILAFLLLFALCSCDELFGSSSSGSAKTEGKKTESATPTVSATQDPEEVTKGPAGDNGYDDPDDPSATDGQGGNATQKPGEQTTQKPSEQTTQKPSEQTTQKPSEQTTRPEGDATKPNEGEEQTTQQKPQDPDDPKPDDPIPQPFPITVIMDGTHMGEVNTAVPVSLDNVLRETVSVGFDSLNLSYMIEIDGREITDGAFEITCACTVNLTMRHGGDHPITIGVTVVLNGMGYDVGEFECGTVTVLDALKVLDQKESHLGVLKNKYIILCNGQEADLNTVLNETVTIYLISEGGSDPVDPTPSDGFLVTIIAYDAIGLFEVTVTDESISLEDLFDKAMQLSFEDITSRYLIVVDGNSVTDRFYRIDGNCEVRLEALGGEAQLITVTVFCNGEWKFESQYGHSTPVSDILMGVFGEYFDQLSARFEIRCNGELIESGDVTLHGDSEITLTDKGQGGEGTDTPVSSFTVSIVWFEMPEYSYDLETGWCYGNKSYFNEIRHAADLYSILCNDLYMHEPEAYQWWMNGELVTDLSAVTVSSDCGLIGIPKEVSFKPFNFTLYEKDENGELHNYGTTTYYGPMFFSDLKKIYKLDSTRYEWTYTLANQIVPDADTAYGRDYVILWDMSLTYYDRTTEILVSTAGPDGVQTVSTVKVIGKLPTLAEFAKNYLEIDDFDSCLFFNNLNDEEAIPLTADESNYYSILVVDKKLIPEQIEITYHVTNKEGEEFAGTLHFSAPLTLAHIFDYEFDVNFSFGDTGYVYKINGTSPAEIAHKGAYFYILYQSCTVEILPAHNFIIRVDNMDPELAQDINLTLETIEGLTVGDLADKIGVDFNRFVWQIDGGFSGEMRREMPLTDLFWDFGDHWIMLMPKTVSFEVLFFDEFGQQNGDSFYGATFETSATVADILKLLNENGYEISLDKYDLWLLPTDPYEWGSGTLVDANHVFLFDDPEQPMMPDCPERLYRIAVRPKAFMVMVEIWGDVTNLEQTHFELTLEEPITVKELLAKLDFSWDCIMRVQINFMDNSYGGDIYQDMEDFIIDRACQIYMDRVTSM